MSPSSIVSVDLAVEQLGAVRVGEHRDAEALGGLLDVDHVVGVVVGDQHVGDLVPSRSTRSSSGSITPLPSTRTPWPPGSSTTR